jgi:hypothetical protein
MGQEKVPKKGRFSGSSEKREDLMGRRQTMELRHVVDGVAFSFKDCINRGCEVGISASSQQVGLGIFRGTVYATSAWYEA